DHGESFQGDEATRRRNLSFDRSAQGRTRLLHRQRRIHPALPGPRTPAVLRESASPRPHVPRSTGRRRHRGDRDPGHCSWRGGPLMPSFVTNYLDKNVQVTPGQYGSLFWALVYILLVFGGVSLAVVCMNWLERKILAHMQVRLGPMRVGPHGLLQPIADALKLILKEDIIPEGADTFVFWLAPMIILLAVFSVYTVVPFGPAHAITDMNIG